MSELRIRIPGNQGVREMHVGQSVLSFGKDGYADADHLSDEEIQRCINFHFVVEGGRATPQAKAPEEAPTLYDDAEDDETTESTQEEPEEAMETQDDAGEPAAKAAPSKPRAPRKPRRTRKGAN